jgi:2'-5' RNA ligase
MTPDPSPWRCFVAVPIPPSLQASLAQATEPLRRHPDAEGWRWTDADAWHVTLAFLGATDPARVPTLATSIANAVSEVAPFAVTAGGMGVFPSRRAARVLWYGIGDPERRLGDLARRVQAAVGLDDASPFRPHVTLARARARSGADPRTLASAELPAGAVDVRGVTLFRSRLGRGPARYEVLAELPLGAPARIGALP